MCTSGGTTSQCNSGWYTGPVTVVWGANPAVSGSSGCMFQFRYDFLQDRVINLSCKGSWPDGSSQTSTFPLHVETSTPTIAGALDRPPDLNGWYNHPVAVSFGGQAFSGIAACSPTSTYAGPASATASVGGSCADNAGKSVGTSVPFAYDATPASLSVASLTGDHTVALNWTTGGDIAPVTSVDVVRTPGMRKARASTVYSSVGNAFTDTRVRNGVRYKYTVIARDQAGNTSVDTITAIPNARLLAPRRGARVAAPPQLAWTPVRHAAYYNVQLYRGAAEVLSSWPKNASLQLRRTWRFDRHLFRLKPGHYRWYVWPGFGRRSASHYGRRIGQGTFTVTRKP
jgi:hypothetical protein